LARYQLYYLLQTRVSAALAAGLRRQAMAATRRPPLREKDLKGLKYFKLLGALLDRLHADATQRDHAGNRRLFYDQYACLLLLFFFNPIVKSLRGIQQASTLDKVQRLFGCNRVSRGSLSEASRVFDPELLHAIIGNVAAQTLPLVHGKEAEALRGLTAVDGSLLPALPKMAWALWLDPQHRAAKMHVHFDVLKGVPVETTVTAGNDSETKQLRATLQAQRLYVIDRGYAEYQLFQDIIDVHSDFIGRLRDNAVWTVVEERPLTAEARAAGVRSDRIVWLGGPQTRVLQILPPCRVAEKTDKFDKT
jgi:Transposase DDE domain